VQVAVDNRTFAGAASPYSSILTRLNLLEAEDDHRGVLAVVTFLEAADRAELVARMRAFPGKDPQNGAFDPAVFRLAGRPGFRVAGPGNGGSPRCCQTAWPRSWIPRPANAAPLKRLRALREQNESLSARRLIRWQQ
jgi:hypothetical protein